MVAKCKIATFCEITQLFDRKNPPQFNSGLEIQLANNPNLNHSANFSQSKVSYQKLPPSVLAGSQHPLAINLSPTTSAIAIL